MQGTDRNEKRIDRKTCDSLTQNLILYRFDCFFYISSVLDTRLLKTGQDVDELADAYVIFITESGVRGKGRPIYRFRRMDEETHEWFEDGSHILYVNGAYQNEESRIGRLMHDFRCTSAAEMHHPVLAEKVRYFKETEGGYHTMCKIMEEARNEAIHEDRVRIAITMLKDGKLTLDLIAMYTKLSLEEVEKLAEDLDA